MCTPNLEPTEVCMPPVQLIPGCLFADLVTCRHLRPVFQKIWLSTLLPIQVSKLPQREHSKSLIIYITGRPLILHLFFYFYFFHSHSDCKTGIKHFASYFCRVCCYSACKKINYFQNFFQGTGWHLAELFFLQRHQCHPAVVKEISCSHFSGLPVLEIFVLM